MFGETRGGEAVSVGGYWGRYGRLCLFICFKCCFFFWRNFGDLPEFFQSVSFNFIFVQDLVMMVDGKAKLDTNRNYRVPDNPVVRPAGRTG